MLRRDPHRWLAGRRVGARRVVDALSWNGVIERLQAKGVQVTARANPGSGHNVPQEAPDAFTGGAT
jgi:hypothetical protein